MPKANVTPNLHLLLRAPPRQLTPPQESAEVSLCSAIVHSRVKSLLAFCSECIPGHLIFMQDVLFGCQVTYTDLSPLHPATVPFCQQCRTLDAMQSWTNSIASYTAMACSIWLCLSTLISHRASTHSTKSLHAAVLLWL